VGIGGIGDGRGFLAYRPEVVGEVENFTDFIPTMSISFPVTVTGESVAVTVGNRLEIERERYAFGPTKKLAFTSLLRGVAVGEVVVAPWQRWAG
jgi:hypothetical protein